MNMHAGSDLTSGQEWEDGKFGLDRESARPVILTEDEVNQATGMRAISIRLENELIEMFKDIAAIHGLGYQPLMRQALNRFAVCEMKRLLGEQAERARQAERESQKGGGARPKKAA
jgi:hypothetical protein